MMEEVYVELEKTLNDLKDPFSEKLDEAPK
jgi:hypothetical protein